MGWVLDCSLTLAWALPDETSERADQLFARAFASGAAWVPSLWWYELANALVVAQRRGRLTEADAAEVARLCGSLPISTDAYLEASTVWRLEALAQRYALSAYDAAYLELAERRGLGLATLDSRLSAAAKQAGVKLLGAAS